MVGIYAYVTVSEVSLKPVNHFISDRFYRILRGSNYPDKREDSIMKSFFSPIYGYYTIRRDEKRSKYFDV